MHLLGYALVKLTTTKWGVKLGHSHIAFGFNTKASSKYMKLYWSANVCWIAISSNSRESTDLVAAQINDLKTLNWLVAALLHVCHQFRWNRIEMMLTTYLQVSVVPFVPSWQDEKTYDSIGWQPIKPKETEMDSFSYSQTSCQPYP